jgi:hypothetical protein
MAVKGLTKDNKRFKLKLLIPKMYLYVKFELNVYNHWGDNQRKLKISDFFSKFKTDNSVSYHQTMIKFDIDQCILMTYPYLQFELNMYNCWGDNEWELKISFFSKLKGHNSAKNDQTMTKFKLGLRIFLTYPYVKFELNV